MSRVFKRDDLKTNRQFLRIMPEGATEELVFDCNGMWGCGQAVDGMDVSYCNNGGVLTNDDLLAIRKAINEHLSNLVKKERE